MVYRRFLIVCFFLILTSCNSEQEIQRSIEPSPPIPEQLEGPFIIENTNLLKNDSIVRYKGVNALHTYGLGNLDLMDIWNVEIIREFIGNLREQPIDGNPFLGSDNVWYHSLQNIVNQNRTHNKITILCPFGWVNSNGQRTLFTGLNPSEQSFYQAYKTKMKLIAEHFKNQPDVWIEVWNEPYHWDNENNYSHSLWLSDMKDMVDNLRWVENFQNIIIVPGNEQGQSENAILEKGNGLLENRYNILFDLHAYEKWLVNTNQEQITTRINRLENNDYAIIIGEIGVQNVGEVMSVEHFLSAAEETNTSTLAWLWKLERGDNNALLAENGEPNASNNNNCWGNTFKEFFER
ncbi:mannan endo-1,4-beta-mannosidase [Tenacibaculum sp. MAR_2009_124]|uniref:cellulase family glycosylhydrolase n=1 Tax=Tenacibaculum sp. MAR_2009_124 TaxID=1250059 RepID=UPI00089C5938|nr:cellulase family glycosylhydrolase [Tenacibaculum sp. MAR_2009_124]SED06617.1 mannan endo-1,4-beta-mannosidase [Tenacibaculum sp. MAR_2009_124]